MSGDLDVVVMRLRDIVEENDEAIAELFEDCERRAREHLVDRGRAVAALKVLDPSLVVEVAEWVLPRMASAEVAGAVQARINVTREWMALAQLGVWPQTFIAGLAEMPEPTAEDLTAIEADSVFEQLLAEEAEIAARCVTPGPSFIGAPESSADVRTAACDIPVEDLPGDVTPPECNIPCSDNTRLLPSADGAVVERMRDEDQATAEWAHRTSPEISAGGADDRETSGAVERPDTPPAASVSSPPAEPTRKTHPRTLPPEFYQQVADVVKAAQAERRNVSVALQDAFDAPPSKSSNWIAKCRRLGLLPPAGTVPVNQSRGLPLGHYEKVAEVVRQARRDGVKVKRALSEAFDGAPYVATKNWVTKCYDMGLLEREPASSDVPKPEVDQVTASDDVATQIDVVALQVELDELERTDPVVDEAARKYDEVVAEIVSGPRPNPIIPSPRPIVEHVPEVTLGEPAADPMAALEAAGTTYEKVADVYLAAVLNDLKPVRVLANLYDVHTVTVNLWLAECRERRLLPPRDQPQVQAVLPDRAMSTQRRSFGGS